MATGYLIWSPSDAMLSSPAPALTVIQGTEASPKKQLIVAAFDASTDEQLTFQFRMPDDYSSSPVVKLLWMTNTASGNSVVWGAKLAAITPADTDTPVEHAFSTVNTTTTAGNATEARRLIETSITMTNADSVAAGDLVFLMITRDADNGSDTLAADAELLVVQLSYTTT